MRNFIRILGYCLAILLVSCASHTTLENLAACKNQCELRNQQCQRVCNNDYKHCHASAKHSTNIYYNHYRHEQAVKGAEAVLELQSFHDPLQCLKTTCECSADYRVCKQSCNGKIRKRLQAPSAC